MMTIIFIRILGVVIGIALLLLLTRFLSKNAVRGQVFLSIGASLLTFFLILSVLLDNDIPILVTSRGISESARFATIYFGLPFGLLFLFVGIYLAMRSMQPEIGSHYSSLVENLLVGVYLIQDGVFKFVNPRLAQLSGYSRAELIGMPVLDLIVRRDKKMVAKNIKKRIEGEEYSFHCEFTGLKKDGSEMQVEVYGNRTMYKGSPAVHGMLLDVSEREKFVNALRISEDRYHALANSSYDIISEITADGQLVYLSDNIEDILGYRPKELLDKSFFMLVHPEDYMTVYSEFDKAINLNISGRTLFRCKHKNGDWRWLESTGQQYIADTGDVRGVIVSRDITLRRTMEEEIFKASKLESIGVLAGGIAHDFNNILTVILGNVSLAKTYVQDISESARILADAEKACLKAKDLTQQFLTFSKGGEPVKKLSSISGLVRETVEFTLHGSKVRCKSEIENNIWAVDIDEGQIGQVIHNLIINSEQAMPEGGIIKVTAKNVELDQGSGLPLDDGRYVQITFEDEGVGIAEDHLSKIFDPYFTTKQKGSGLGLTTSYSIIKNHGGLLTVSSKLGVGTTFYIYLPAIIAQKYEKDSVVEEEIMESPTIQNARILVMDDEDAIRKSVGRMLTHLGYDVVVSEDGHETVERYKEAKASGNPFDAVLMDLTIPGGMGGKETMSKLMKIDSEIKAIVSSGYSNDPIMAEFRDHGFSGVIAKPYQLDHLNRAIQDVISQQ
jgi:PAS domain S-box-containing protein